MDTPKTSTFKWSEAHQKTLEAFVAQNGASLDDPSLPDPKDLYNTMMTEMTFNMAAKTSPELMAIAMTLGKQSLQDFQQLLMGLYYFGVLNGITMERNRTSPAASDELEAWFKKLHGEIN
jgi:hypothetical protein